MRQRTHMAAFFVAAICWVAGAVTASAYGRTLPAKTVAGAIELGPGGQVQLDASGAVTRIGADGSAAVVRISVVLGPSGRVVPTLSLASRSQPEGGAGLVRFEGSDPRDPAVRVALTYMADPQTKRLRMILEVENSGHGHYAPFPVGLLIEWGDASAVLPGLEVEAGRRKTVGWVGGQGPSGFIVAAEAGRMLSESGVGWTLVRPAPMRLPPGRRGESVVSLRWASTVDGALAAWSAARKGVIGTVRGQVSGLGAVSPSPVRVEARDLQGALLTLTVADADGRFELSTRPGTVRLRALGAGRAAGPVRTVEVRVGHPAEAALVATPSGLARFSLSDAAGVATPGLVRLSRRDGAVVTLGPPGAFPAAADRVVLGTGAIEVPLAPGFYEAVFSRGPTSASAQVNFLVAEDAVVDVDARLSAGFDPGEWQPMDLRVDAGTLTPERRVGWCEAAGMARWFTNDPRGPIGGDEAHYAALDVFGEARFAAYGTPGPAPSAQRAAAALKTFETRYPGAPRAVFRPRAAGWAYFDRFGFDPEKVALPAGFSLDFELLELAAQGTLGARAQVFEDYLGLLRRGRRIGPIAGSGAGGVGRRCGWPFTWVREDTLSSAFEGGGLVVSSGPLLELTVAEAEITLRVRANANQRPTRLSLYGPDGVVARWAVPVGEDALDYTVRKAIERPAEWWVASAGTTIKSEVSGQPVFAYTAAVRGAAASGLKQGTAKKQQP